MERWVTSRQRGHELFRCRDLFDDQPGDEEDEHERERLAEESGILVRA